MEDYSVIPMQDLEPAYKEPEVADIDEVSFNIDYYMSHYVPIREIIELKKAVHE